MSAEINKAWWIAHVKQYGDGGGIQYLAEKAGTYYAKAKPAIDLLVNLKLIDMQKAGTSVKYTVTTLGHRYLNENRDELEDAEVVAPPQDEPEPMQPVAVTHHQSSTAPVEKSRVPISYAFPSTQTNLPAPAAGGVLVQAPADQQTLKDALYDIMYERFADQVTAKELLDRLKGGKV
jgi:hypothetical protein